MKTGDDLYFAICESTSRIKIGRSSSPERRLKEIQAGSPTPLRLVPLSGLGHLEPILHRQFREYRLHNEWFATAKPLVALVNKLIDPVGRMTRMGFPFEILKHVIELETHYVVPRNGVDVVVPLDEMTLQDVEGLRDRLKEQLEEVKRRFFGWDAFVMSAEHFGYSDKEQRFGDLFKDDEGRTDLARLHEPGAPTDETGGMDNDR